MYGSLNYEWGRDKSHHGNYQHPKWKYSLLVFTKTCIKLNLIKLTNTELRTAPIITMYVMDMMNVLYCLYVNPDDLIFLPWRKRKRRIVFSLVLFSAAVTSSIRVWKSTKRVKWWGSVLRRQWQTQTPDQWVSRVPSLNQTSRNSIHFSLINPIFI